ncbi:MAG: histidinol dehydrogenase [SAR202 cluster bacterium]|nr:histidinol dehydrogenase [Chloroflexota bacterium]MQG43591.1 histidinol dehydrogenase [SAR202 cluster bacterium]|tara:strand:- start:1545 stop:2861 length:1317 start_codon:yes stop_codon:yes gene_type:complete
MKILMGKKATQDYLNKIRTNSYSSISSDGNGYFSKTYELEQYIGKIIELTKKKGDDFLVEISSKIDGVPFGGIKVRKNILDESVSQISKKEKEVILNTIERVKLFQSKTLSKSWFDEEKGYGEYVRPIESVGCYIPSGSAPLISTIIMTVVPAKIAGVKRIAVSSPTPGNQNPNKYLLATAKLCGVDEFYTYGGPQAITAMAYGTETIPRVDLICGPGNIFVMNAKKQVYGDVGVDGIFGPTETLIICDQSSNIDFIVSDLMAQAEHDVLALPIVITNQMDLANSINSLYLEKLSSLDRKDIIKKSMERGFISIINEEEEMVEVANLIAAEHTTIPSENLIHLSKKINSSGSLFLGEISSEVLADYVAGPSHVMPTNGSARYSSSLSTRTFTKNIPVLSIDKEEFDKICEDGELLASLESLDAHKNALTVRKNFFTGE